MVKDPDEKILVVDDNKHTRKMFKDMLEELGIKKYKEAKDGEEALEILEKNGIGLTFLDMKLPGMNGDKVLQEIRKKDEIETKVVIITGVVDEDITEKCLDEGAIEYITKPYRVEKIKKIIEKHT